MAQRIDIDGSTRELPNSEYNTVREAVGGWLELVHVPGGTSDAVAMYVDEEGLLKGLPQNNAASALAGQRIVGPVVVITADELRADMAADDDGDE